MDEANTRARGPGHEEPEPAVADVLGDAVEVAQRAASAWSEVRRDWEQRSLTDTPWTTDTIMNEVVNSWERITPLMGEAIETGITGMTWMLRTLWPAAADDLGRLRSAVGDTPAAPFLHAPEHAVARMLDGTYRSADVIEDWANLFGLAVKTAWRVSATGDGGTGEGQGDGGATSTGATGEGQGDGGATGGGTSDGATATSAGSVPPASAEPV